MTVIAEVDDVFTDAEKENSVQYGSSTKKQLTGSSFIVEDEEEAGFELNLDEIPYCLTPKTLSSKASSDNQNLLSFSATKIVEEPVVLEDETNLREFTPKSKTPILKVTNATPNSRFFSDTQMVEEPEVVEDETNLPEFSPISKTVIEEETKLPERNIVDYDTNPSAIYKAMQVKDWNMVMDQVDQNPNQVSTWISRTGKDGEIRWCLLPIHAALIFKAPVHVIVRLLSIYPESGTCKDDQGMVPLHLAFRHGSHDAILYEILSFCPDAIDAKDSKGRTPLALHSTYVARANLQETPSANGDNVHKMRASAFEKYVNVASERTRKSTKSKLEAHYVKKLKTIHDEHTEQLENLRKLASDEFAASRERIKELEKKKKSLEATLKDKKEFTDVSKQNEANKLTICNMEALLENIRKTMDEEKTEFLQKNSNLEDELEDTTKRYKHEVTVLEEKAKISEENLADLIDKLSSAEEEIENLKKSTSEMESKILELSTLVEARVAANEELSKNYEAICESESYFKAALAEKKLSVIDKMKELKDSGELMGKMNLTIRELRADVTSKTINVRTLTENIEKLIHDNNEQKEMAEELELKNRELNASNEELKLKHHIQSCANQDLTEELSELNADFKQNSEKLKLSEEACKSLIASIADGEARLGENIEAEAALKMLMEEKEFEYEQSKVALEEEVQQLTQDLGDQVMRTSDVEIKFNDLQQMYSKAQRKFETKCKELDELDAELEETRAQSLEELELKEEELNRMMTSLAEYNTKFQQIAKSSEILAEEFKLKCDQEVELRDELEQIRAEFEEMVALKENEFCNLKENYQLVENEVSELKNEVETLEEEQVVSKNVISELAQNLSICNNQIIQLEKELGDSEEAMKAVAAFSEEKEQQLEEKIAQQELESLRALKSTNDLVKSNEGLAVIVQDLQRDVEAKEKCLKQQKEDAEMRLSYFRSELEEVTTSSAKEIVELKSKLTEKVKESLRHNEKNQFFEEVGAQMRRRVMDLEHENNKIEIQMKEKMIASGAAHCRLSHQLIELETSKSKELEEIKRKAADTQAQLEREMKHVKSVNDKKTEMNTTLQRQLREMSSHMQQLTDNLLKLSSQHEKFVDLATSHGVSFDLMAGSNK